MLWVVVQCLIVIHLLNKSLISILRLVKGESVVVVVLLIIELYYSTICDWRNIGSSSSSIAIG